MGEVAGSLQRRKLRPNSRSSPLDLRKPHKLLRRHGPARRQVSVDHKLEEELLPGGEHARDSTRGAGWPSPRLVLFRPRPRPGTTLPASGKVERGGPPGAPSRYETRISASALRMV